jgi:hypothetical protein
VHANLDSLLTGIYVLADSPRRATPVVRRGSSRLGAGLIFWLLLGATVVRWCDRKGLHRLADLLAHVHHAVGDYRARTQPSARGGDKVERSQ